jgi:hypothetical protein
LAKQNLDDFFWNREAINKSIYALIARHPYKLNDPKYDFVAAFYKKLQASNYRLEGTNHEDIIQRFILYSLITPGKSNLFKRFNPDKNCKLENFILQSFTLLIPVLLRPYKKDSDRYIVCEDTLMRFFDEGRLDVVDIHVMENIIRKQLDEPKHKKHFNMLVCGYKPSEIQKFVGYSSKQLKLSQAHIANTVRKILNN